MNEAMMSAAGLALGLAVAVTVMATILMLNTWAVHVKERRLNERIAGIRGQAMTYEHHEDGGSLRVDSEEEDNPQGL
jgi:hypothetical protein